MLKIYSLEIALYIIYNKYDMPYNVESIRLEIGKQSGGGGTH